MRSGKSRRDGILLTVDFNLRTKDTAHLLQVTQGRHFGIIVSSLRDFRGIVFRLLRRLKPTVNQVLSLRDIFAADVTPYTNCLYLHS